MVRGAEKEFARHHYSLLTTHFNLHPLTAKAVPSPYEQGESAVRFFLISPFNLWTSSICFLTQ